MKNIFLPTFTMIFLFGINLSFSQTSIQFGEYQSEILGTWVFEDDSNASLYFDENGTVKRYHNNNLMSTDQYVITDECDGELRSPQQNPFLKIITSNGAEDCAYIENINYENNGRMVLMTKNQGKVIVYERP